MKMELNIKFDETEISQVDDFLDGEGYRRVVEDTLTFIRNRLKQVGVSVIEEGTLELVRDEMLSLLRDHVPGGVERLL